MLSKSAMEEFQEYASTTSSVSQHHDQYDSVVMGLSPAHLNYDTLTTAFRVLSSDQFSPKPLITTHRARYIRTLDGELSLGPGPFVKALEEAMGDGFAAEAVGKPGKTFFDRVIGSIHDPQSSSKSVSRGKVAIIGDDVEADLGGAAVELGLWRVLGMSLPIWSLLTSSHNEFSKNGEVQSER